MPESKTFPDHIIVVSELQDGIKSNHREIAGNLVNEYQEGEIKMPNGEKGADPGIEVDNSDDPDGFTYIQFGTGYDPGLRDQCVDLLVKRGVPRDRIQVFDNVAHRSSHVR